MFHSKDVSKTTKPHNFRKAMRHGHDKKVFAKTADRSRVENFRRVAMRGGFRL